MLSNQSSSMRTTSMFSVRTPMFSSLNLSANSLPSRRSIERGHLDLTVEAVIHDNQKWHPLFIEDELAICTKRPKDYKYLQ